MDKPLLRSLAEKVLGPELAKKIWKRIEIIGDIAIIRKPFDIDIELLKPLGEELLKSIPYIESVWLAISPVQGIERTRRYVHIAGSRKTTTIYREHGCSFMVDIEHVYVSPTLSYDHIRIAKQVREGEEILNLFAGIGGYTIVISRHAKPSYILSIDINPIAIKLLRKNTELNHVESINEVIHGDATRLCDAFRSRFDRILLPLPELSYPVFPCALRSLKDEGYIHPHEFVEARNRKEAISKTISIYTELAEKHGVKVYVRGYHVIRSVGPRKYHVTLDLYIVKK